MRKRFFLTLSLLILLGSMALTTHRNISHAENDEDEEEYEDERDQEKEVRSDDGSVKRTNTSKELLFVPITTTTQQEIRTILTDSDGDGLYDNEDPHPDIPELYIVLDDNKNGIVDRFESPL